MSIDEAVNIVYDKLSEVIPVIHMKETVDSLLEDGEFYDAYITLREGDPCFESEEVDEKHSTIYNDYEYAEIIDAIEERL